MLEQPLTIYPSLFTACITIHKQYMIREHDYLTTRALSHESEQG